MSEPDSTRFLPLIRFEDKEGARTWTDFEKDPQDLFNYLIKFFGIDPILLDSIQRLSIGEATPETDTIWFNNSPIAPFIGIPIAGEFVKFFEYPPNSPFILLDANKAVRGVRSLTQEEIDNYGLTILNPPAFWAILEVIT